jgi:hypothetical protein
LAGNNEIALAFAFFTCAGSTYNATDNTSWDVYSAGRLAYGQTLNLNGTLNATFKVTGFQLEVGEVATEFEYVGIAEETNRCERYYQTSWTRTIGGGQVVAGGYYEFDSVYLTHIYERHSYYNTNICRFCSVCCSCAYNC